MDGLQRWGVVMGIGWGQTEQLDQVLDQLRSLADRLLVPETEGVT